MTGKLDRAVPVRQVIPFDDKDNPNDLAAVTRHAESYRIRTLSRRELSARIARVTLVA